MDTYVITLPEVKAVSLRPSTVAAGQPYTVSVTVEEVEKILYPEILYSGEIYAGES